MNLQHFPLVAENDYPARLGLMQAGLDMVNQGFTIIDADLRLVAWNRAFIEMLEFPPEFGHFGTPFETFMRYNAERGEYGPGPVAELVAERVKAARAFEPHYFERIRPNGRIIAVRGQPMPGRGFVTLYTDITEQRRIETLIREQNAELERRVEERTKTLARVEERQRLIMDNIPALISYFDHRRIYRFVNRGYAKWFERSKEELVDRPLDEVMGAALHAELQPHIDAVLAGEPVSYEYSLTRSDGSVKHAASTLVPEFGPEGKVFGAYVLSADITEQRNVQAALLQARKMEAVGQLAGGLAHDFNNMLTVIIGNLAVIQERRSGDPLLTDHLAPALTAARRGVDLIRRLLTFARQQPLEPRPVDAIGLVRGLLPLLRRSFPENIVIETALPDTALWAFTDGHQLENALLNLAFNARDAMATGGHLTISAGASGSRPKFIDIAVADNGQGMSADVLARAVDPFFTTKSFAEGSGLGLSMVYAFARQCGGNLIMDSRSGSGTRACLQLPACDPETADADVGIPSTLAADERGLVLLVEDDPEVRRIIRMQLTGFGLSVVEAESGNEALSLIEQLQDVSYLVSDIVMPGEVDGLTLARRVRDRRSRIGIVLMTGYAGGNDPSCDEFPVLTKPFAVEALAAALSACKP